MGQCASGGQGANEQLADTSTITKTNVSNVSNVSNERKSENDEIKSDVPRKLFKQPSGLRGKLDVGGQQEMTIRIIQGKNLPKSDKFGTIDAYVVVSAGKQKYQTSIIKNNSNPKWNDDIILSGKTLFNVVKDLSFDLYDWDRVGRNEHIGHFEIHFKNNLTECETPALWYEIEDLKGNTIDGAEIQVQLQFRADVSVISARNYTHVLQLNVISGNNFHNMSWLEKGDPYVSVEIGKQRFRTSTKKQINDKKNPEWNEALYLFINSDTQKEWQVVISVLDKDLHNDDHIGTGYLQISTIYDSPNRTFEGSIELQRKIINLDKALGNIPVSPISNGKSDEHDCGSIKLSAQLIPRRKIEADFFENLLNDFDVNNNGKLDKIEVAQMLCYLDAQTNVDDFMNRFDDYDNELTRQEVLKMLTDSQFQESEDAPKFILYHLNSNKDLDPFSNKLMEGLFRAPLNEATARTTLEVRSRKTGIIVNEHIPGYIQFAFNLMYKNSTGKLLSGTDAVQKILLKMSVDKGKQFDKPESVQNIATFIETFNLDTSILDKKDISEYNTFNDFFARGIRFKEVRPMTEDDTEIVSPADCRMVVFKNVYESTKFWVKGENFTLETVLGQRKEISPAFEGGAFCIARLAPQDYHRWHWPCGGKITKITPIEGHLYSVNPIVINRNVDVFSDNKRCIIEMDTDHHGKLVMVAVAATLVGSYNLFQTSNVKLEVGHKVLRGDVSGEFRYGGSTILLFFERNRLEWKEDLLASTNEKMETLIEVRDTIGGLPGKTNISNMVRQQS